MSTDEIDRVRLRFVIGSYVNMLLVIGVLAFFAFTLPFPGIIVYTPVATIELWRILFRQATSIRFEPTGVEVGLLFRKLHLRAPVAEFRGSRFRPIRVCDLHSGKRYELTQWFGSQRLIRVAERYGYPVLRRPEHIFQSTEGPG